MLFLAAAIFAGRVRRSDVGGQSRWVARPDVRDSLSAIVLSLFAADILWRREWYDASLCVCDVCGSVSFDGASDRRFRCGAHGVVA